MNPDAPMPTEEAVPVGPAAPSAELEALLQDVEMMEVPNTSEAPTADWTLLGPVVALMAAASVLWFTRRRLLGAYHRVPDSEMRVVGRTVLAGTAGLSVVEVRGRDGTWRRLVVGTGDGPPRLVADLGEPEFGFLGPEQEEEEEPSFDPAGAVTAQDDFEPLAVPRSLSMAMQRIRPRAEISPPPPIRRRSTTPDLDRQARLLIDEVLGERQQPPPPPRRSRWSTFA
ncbi:MAG: hypothetical protein KTR31_23500 [Myxococcales bacterium]|nr:hypothetical protein [Myxococcales bacterium]